MTTVGDQARVGLILVLLYSLSVGLTLFPFEKIRHALLWMTGRLRRIVVGTPTARRVARTVERVDHVVPGHRTCLVRSLATETVLRLYDYDPVHRIGVDKTEREEIEAHSWLEHGDEILIGDVKDISRYEPLPPLSTGDGP